MKMTIKSHIEYKATVEIDGANYDADDLIELTEALICEDDIIIEDNRVVFMLTDKGLLESAGSQKWCSRASVKDMVKMKDFRENLHALREQAITLHSLTLLGNFDILDHNS